MSNVRPDVSSTLAQLQPFVEAGYTIFPLQPASKVPSHEGWRTADYTGFDIAQHLKRGGNLGIRLGPDDVVLDVDPRNGGEESFQRLSWLMDEAAPRVRTGSDGLHLYLKKPAGVRLRGKLAGYPGIDIKAQGGFVVAPGSIHPDTGKPYVVDDAFPSVKSAPPIPDAVLDEARRPDPAERTGDGGELTADQLRGLLDVLDPSTYANYDDWLRISAACHDAVGGDPEGMAVWLDWCARDESYGAVASAQNEAKWDTFTSGRPDGVTYRSLLKAVADAGRSDLVCALSAGEFDDDLDLPSDESGERHNRYHRWSLDELLALPAPNWTVDGILLERSLAMLYGEPKSFKTFIALDLALSIATGLPFHGVRTEKGRVCYVAAEGHARELGERVLAWTMEHKVDVAQLRGQFAMVTSGVRLDEPTSVKDFIKEDSAPCDVVFFDTLNRNMTGNENDTQDVTKVSAGCDYVRRALRTAVVLVHHTGVSGQRERGSSVLRGAVDSKLRVTRNAKTRGSTLLMEELRSGPSGAEMEFVPVQKVVDAESLRSTLVMRLAEPGDVQSDEEAPDDLTPLQKLLIDIYEMRPKKQKDLVDLEGRDGSAQSTISRKVKRLTEDGYLRPSTVELTRKGEDEAERLIELRNSSSTTPE